MTVTELLQLALKENTQIIIIPNFDKKTFSITLISLLSQESGRLRTESVEKTEGNLLYDYEDGVDGGEMILAETFKRLKK